MPLFKLKDANIDYTEFWLETDKATSTVFLMCCNKDIDMGIANIVLIINKNGLTPRHSIGKGMGFALTKYGTIFINQSDS